MILRDVQVAHLIKFFGKLSMFHYHLPPWLFGLKIALSNILYHYGQNNCRPNSYQKFDLEVTIFDGSNEDSKIRIYNLFISFRKGWKYYKFHHTLQFVQVQALAYIYIGVSSPKESTWNWDETLKSV